MYITEPCVAFGLMAKSRKEASRENKIYKICIKLTLTPPPPKKKKRKKERKGRAKRKKALLGIKPRTSCSLGNWLQICHLWMNNQFVDNILLKAFPIELPLASAILNTNSKICFSNMTGALTVKTQP